jgi:D-amino-acid oxidase
LTAGRVVDGDAVVIGAGVIGLSTAIVLAEAGRPVRILAAAPPQQTTSRAAAAIWTPSDADPRERVEHWGLQTLATLRELAGVPESGVHLAHGTLAWPVAAEPPALERFPGSAPVPCAPPGAGGLAGAVRLQLPLVDMPRYLEYLQQRARAAGATIELRELASLAPAAALAPVLVNCSGMGARALAGDNAVRAVRGQHVVVENPGVEEFFLEEWSPGQHEWTSWWPHAGTVVIGGLAGEDDERLAPDLAASARMLARAAEREPRLRGARVLEHRVGLRPTRAVIRVDEERIGEARCVHAYGHGRSGVSLSWGCAHEVASLLAG